MPDFSVGLDNVRKKTLEDIKAGGHGISTVLKNFDINQIGMCLSTGNIHPSSAKNGINSSTASSL